MQIRIPVEWDASPVRPDPASHLKMRYAVLVVLKSELSAHMTFAEQHSAYERSSGHGAGSIGMFMLKRPSH